MFKLIWKTVINTLALYLVSYLIPPIAVDNPLTAILAGLILTLLSITIRPILMVLCLPLNLISLGVFILIINTWMLELTDLMVGGLHIQGFLTALVASLVIMLINYLASRCVSSKQGSLLNR
ncbi:MAG: phage holin family protein [Syntrophomonas sp.]